MQWEVFEESDYEGGYGWHGATEALVKMRAPELMPKLHFDPEASMVQVSSSNRDALLQVASRMHQLLADANLLREVLGRVDAELMD